MKSLCLITAAVVLASPASAAVGVWGKGQRAEARLIASGVDDTGKLAAAIEIVLPPGWKTYWRNPGDAGVVPVIDFSGSVNSTATEVAFPVPQRDDDGFAVTNIYRDRVTLPVSAAVADRTKPVELSAKLTIGVCDEICVPDEIAVHLAVPVGEKDAAAAGAIAAARALIPGPAEAGTFALAKVSRDGGTDNRPVFRFSGIVPDAAKAQVFVEGPADWAPYTPDLISNENGNVVYSVKFSRTGSKIPIADAKFRVTILSAGRAIDQTLPLD